MQKAESEVDEPVIDEPETEIENEQEAVEGEELETDEGSEVSVSIGEESPTSEEAEQEPSLVLSELRKRYEVEKSQRRAAEKRARDAEEKAQKSMPAKVELGPKPTLADADFDEELFEKKLDEWKAIKADHEEGARKQEATTLAESKAYQAKFADYTEQKTALKVKDFEDAESEVTQTLSPVQQSILVKYAKSSATLVYALGKNPETAKKLASIKDPIEFALAARDLESKVKVTPRNTKPAPDSPVRGSAPASAGNTATLKRLEADALKSGDRTEVVRYKKQLQTKKP